MHAVARHAVVSGVKYHVSHSGRVGARQLAKARHHARHRDVLERPARVLALQHQLDRPAHRVEGCGDARGGRAADAGFAEARTRRAQVHVYVGLSLGPVDLVSSQRGAAGCASSRAGGARQRAWSVLLLLLLLMLRGSGWRGLWCRPKIRRGAPPLRNERHHKLGAGAALRECGMPRPSSPGRRGIRRGGIWLGG